MLRKRSALKIVQEDKGIGKWTGSSAGPSETEKREDEARVTLERYIFAQGAVKSCTATWSSHSRCSTIPLRRPTHDTWEEQLLLSSPKNTRACLCWQNRPNQDRHAFLTPLHLSSSLWHHPHHTRTSHRLVLTVLEGAGSTELHYSLEPQGCCCPGVHTG